LYQQPLAQLYPDLFKMAQQQDITLADVKHYNHLGLTFSRWLIDDWNVQLDTIIADMANIYNNLEI
jgi:hypothetical protein